jgi:Protein of unknown function (DUF3592)
MNATQGSAGTGALPIDTPVVKEGIRAGRRRGAVFVLIGLALLVAFGAVVLSVDDPLAILETPDVRTSGRVTDVYRDHGTLRVEYSYRGSTRSALLDLRDDEGRVHDVGQTIVLYVDKAYPDEVSLEAREDQPSWSAVAFIGLFLPGLGAVGLGVFTFRDIGARRRTLSRPPAYDPAAWAAQHWPQR